jgi:propionyl-CoA synthetase
MGDYEDSHRRSLEDPEGFWADAARDVHWDRPWDRVLDARSAPLYRWFSGGALNTCFNAVDLHVEQGRGEQRALVYDSPVTGSQRTLS